MRRLLSFLLLTGWLAAAGLAAAPPAPTVILVSIDGVRWDYLDRYAAPTLRRLAAEGVRATRLNASFPTKTFPNLYTLVTGLRPGHHGMIANWFHDPATGQSFSQSRLETEWWAGGEPVWITAEKAGVRTACMFWPGSETELQGLRPTHYRPFDMKLSPADRVDGLLAWLDAPAAERPRFLTLYFDHTDTAGHTYGPDSPEAAAAFAQADAALARLLEGLERRGLGASTNLVIVSDHGMAPTSPERVVFLDDLMDIQEVSVEATGPYAGVRPKPGVDVAALVTGIRQRVSELMASSAAPYPRVRVYRREKTPADLHYDSGDRIPPVLLLIETGWSFELKTGWPLRRPGFSRGNHGWEPSTPEMGALFVAHGPAFRPHTVLASAENVDLYNLLCAVLGLTPAPNDGSDALVRAALRR